MDGHDGRHLAISTAPFVLILLASRLQSRSITTITANCTANIRLNILINLYCKHPDTYSSLFNIVHRGRTSASFRARVSPHSFQDKLRKRKLYKLCFFECSHSACYISNFRSHLTSSMAGQCLRDDATPTRSELPIEVKLKQVHFSIR